MPTYMGTDGIIATYFGTEDLTEIYEGAAPVLATDTPPASPLFRAASSGETTDDGASITLTHPTGTAEEDLLYALVGAHRSNGTAPLLSSHGWTPLSSLKSSNYHVTLFRKVVNSTDVARGNSTFSIPADGTNSHFWGAIGAWEAGSFNASTPEDATTTQNSGSGTTSAVAPTITTVTNNAVVVHFMSTDFRDITALPSGDVAFNKKHTESLGGHATAVYNTKASAGASGTEAFTLNSTGEFVGFAVAIKPAS